MELPPNESFLISAGVTCQIDLEATGGHPESVVTRDLDTLLTALHARMAQRLSGMAAIWRNGATGAPVERSLITYDNGTHKESLI
jgi:hypothetical protein